MRRGRVCAGVGGVRGARAALLSSKALVVCARTQTQVSLLKPPSVFKDNITAMITESDTADSYVGGSARRAASASVAVSGA